MQFLVAVDGSDEAAAALAYATDVAEAMDGSITVVLSVDPTIHDVGGSEPITSLSDVDRRLIVESVADAEQRGLDVLEETVERVDEDVDVDGELLYGNPVATVTDYAESEGFDAIFVGHQGRSERAGSMLGSVAKSIVERATVPVTVVR